VETADGCRGFCPSQIVEPGIVSDFTMCFWKCGHGKYHGYADCFKSFNTRWTRCGLAGTGIEQLRVNWGSGGHDVYPDVAYSGMQYTHKKCSKCKSVKPREEFSRYQWESDPDSGVCMGCENNSEDCCRCVRNLETWVLCHWCISQATSHSAAAHTYASQHASKLMPSSSTRPRSAVVRLEHGRVIGCP